MRNNIFIKHSSHLITTPDARRNGFVEYVSRRNRESEEYLQLAKDFREALQKHTTHCRDIFALPENFTLALMQAAGISVKAEKQVSKEDQKEILNELIEKALAATGEKFRDEIIARYLLTLGDALGGKMRNIVGAIAGEKVNRSILTQLHKHRLSHNVLLSTGEVIDDEHVGKLELSKIKGISWVIGSTERCVIYNSKVPKVNKNIDIILLQHEIERGIPESKLKAKLKAALAKEDCYKAIGELKGGIDPAGADEHWKTANSALGRVRESFRGQLPLFFIGAAIEAAMAEEIFDQCERGDLQNCANLNNQDQLDSLTDWLITL